MGRLPQFAEFSTQDSSLSATGDTGLTLQIAPHYLRSIGQRSEPEWVWSQRSDQAQMGTFSSGFPCREL